MSEQIQRPAYYALIAGLAWEEPKEMRDRWMAGNDPALINKLKSELAASSVSNSRRRRMIGPNWPVPGAAERAGVACNPPPPPRGGSGGRGGGRPGPGTGSGRQTPQPKDQDPATPGAQRQAKVNNLKSKVPRPSSDALGKSGRWMTSPATTDHARRAGGREAAARERRGEVVGARHDGDPRGGVSLPHARRREQPALWCEPAGSEQATSALTRCSLVSSPVEWTAAWRWI